MRAGAVSAVGTRRPILPADPVTRATRAAVRSRVSGSMTVAKASAARASAADITNGAEKPHWSKSTPPITGPRMNPAP